MSPPRTEFNRGLLATLTALVAFAAHAGDRPNVLLIIADDLNTCLRCYGHPLVKTPHIDRLAERGVRFAYAYAQYPLCNPSRVSFLTGRYPAIDGVKGNHDDFRKRMPDVITLPQQFNAQGYKTVRIGKIFHLDDERSWSVGGKPIKKTLKRHSTQADYERYRKRSDRWEPIAGDGEDERDYELASQAIEALRENKESLFFIAVGFRNPHTPFVAPRKYFELYPPDSVTLPVDFSIEIAAPPGVPVKAFGRPADLFVERRPTLETAREATAAYYATVSFLDAQVGRVLDELTRLGLNDDTIVVFLSDQGFHLGEKGKWSKHDSLFEPALRVPLIVAAPDRLSGAVSTRTVELIDLYPTLIELAKIPEPEGLEGESFAALLSNPDAKWNDLAFSYSHTPVGYGSSVRDDRYRYTEWGAQGTAGAVFHDLVSDPAQTVNLIDDPVHIDRVLKLMKAIYER